MLKKPNCDNFKVGSITMFMLKFPMMVRNTYLQDGFSQKNLSMEIRQPKLVLLQEALKKTILLNCTDSPTCGKESLGIAIAIIITNGWEINSLDVKSAFLQGKEISRDLFVKPLKEAKTDNLWKLLKTIYGLNDASRTWYLHVRDEFIICDACVSKYNEAIFYWHYKNTLQGVVCSHVDAVRLTSFGEYHNFS